MDRDTALGLGVRIFLDLEEDKAEDAGEVDAVFDVLGGEYRDRSTALVRAGDTLVSTIGTPTVQPKDSRDRSRLVYLAQRLRGGRLKPIVEAVRPLAEAAAAFTPDRPTPARRSFESTTEVSCLLRDRPIGVWAS